jgi:hypothetical protein
MLASGFFLVSPKEPSIGSSIYTDRMPIPKGDPE